MDDFYYDNEPEQQPLENISPDCGSASSYPPHSYELQKKNPQKGKAGFIAAALCFSLVGSILGAGGVLLVDHLGENKEVPSENRENLSIMLEGQRETSTLEIVNIDSSKVLTAAEVYAANVNSTVGITTSVTTNYWGFQTTSAASGSGFIITTDGYVLTNYHVIESADTITVSMYNGDSYEAALIGYDESNDIAVLKIEAEEDLTPVVLGNSDQLNVGDSVVAIGNPLGELTFSLTAGTVSAKDREVTLSSTVTMDLIQTDCAINSGNSGGALFNLYGEVIGITNAKYSNSSSSGASIDNIGFAIPINSILNIVESIIEKGYISKPYIGIYFSDVSEQTQLSGAPSGAFIQSVIEDAPAARAGLQTGDIITRIDGTQITNGNGLKEIVGNAAIGDELILTVYRKGEIIELALTVGEQMQSALANETAQAEQQQSSQSGFPWGSGVFGDKP